MAALIAGLGAHPGEGGTHEALESLRRLIGQSLANRSRWEEWWDANRGGWPGQAR